jgi:WD40 repeat protein
MDDTARVFEAVSWKEVSRFTHHPGGVFAVAFSTDSRYVATGSGDGTARLFEAVSGREIYRLVHQGRVIAVAISPDGRYVATGSMDGTARVFDALTETETSRFPHENEKVVSAAFSGDGRYLATGCADTKVRVFDASTGERILLLDKEDPEEALALSLDGGYLGTASHSGVARVIDVRHGQEISRLTNLRWLDSLAFTPTGQVVLAGSPNGRARMFEVISGNEVVTLPEHQDSVDVFGFSSDGRYLATGKEDQAEVFETATKKRISHIRQGTPIKALALIPDNRDEPSHAARTLSIATGSEENMARVFEVEIKSGTVTEGMEVSRMTLSGPVLAVRFGKEKDPSANPPNSSRPFLITASFSIPHDEVVLTRHFLRKQDLLEDACSRLTRNLKEKEEWKLYVGAEMPYHRTCPSRPALTNGKN